MMPHVLCTLQTYLFTSSWSYVGYIPARIVRRHNLSHTMSVTYYFTPTSLWALPFRCYYLGLLWGHFIWNISSASCWYLMK